MSWRASWYLRSPRVRTPPAYLNMEPTNRCNLSCKWCVASTARPTGMLDMAVADGVMDQASRAGVREIRFFLAGEPLLHPRIDDLVTQATRRGLRSVLHTNAMLLDRERGRGLIEAGLDEISFSINGVEDATVGEVQRGANLHVMAGNVRSFLDVRRRSGHRIPRTILQIIQSPSEAATPLPSHRLTTLFGAPGPDRILRLAPHGWGGQLRSSEVVLRGTRYHPCQPLWQGMSMGWDGRVFLCCGDLNGTHEVGDLNRDDLMEVWRGPALTRIRQLVACNTRNGLALCASCDAVWWKYHPMVHDARRALWIISKCMPSHA